MRMTTGQTDDRRDAAFDLTIALACHRERHLAQATLRSIARARAYCDQRGITSELIVTLDRADAQTRRVVDEFPRRQSDRVVELDVGDLGQSRNAAVDLARGRLVAVCDGDDLYSQDWFARCVAFASQHGTVTVMHPHLVVLFDQWHAHSWQRDQLHPDFDVDCMLTINPWNSCCCADRSVFRAHPYATARPGESGFGYEDWHWNCQTLASGLVHRVVPETVHFVRRKRVDSLNAAQSPVDGRVRPPAGFGGSRWARSVCCDAPFARSTGWCCPGFRTRPSAR